MSQHPQASNQAPTQTLPPSEAATVQPQAALVVRRDGQPTTDLHVLLRKRLRFLAFLMAAGMAIVVLLALFLHDSPWVATLAYCLIFAELAVVAAVLWKKSSLSLRQLRVIELLLFGTMAAFWAMGHAGVYPSFRLEQPPPGWFGPIMAYAISLPWAFIIMVYGIFIPNTWRRCAAVVGAAAVIPLVISLTTGIAADATRGQGPVLFWVSMAVWMAVAAAVAIYGSHRIEVLRVEASNARRLGPYELKQRLGSGGMGEVYLAQHRLLRRPCAIKLIRAERASDPNTLLRFEREVQATATLTHPNTVQIFDYGHAEDGAFYYAMEYLPGLSLQEMTERHGALPAARAVFLLRQVCGALREAHAIGLIHRDIKPSNVLVCARGGLHDVVKLLDFGLVQATAADHQDDKLTQEGAVLGTPAYMSPEQAAGPGNVDARSDLYSLGAVAYFLVTAVAPFKGRSAVEILAAHLYEPVKPLRSVCPDFPADVEEVVLRCLEKDPGKRYPDADRLDQALARCRCAGDWSWQTAADWWRQHTVGE
jgi:serine/threonine-protein kinase